MRGQTMQPTAEQGKNDLTDATLMALLDALMSEADPDGMPSERARAVAAKVPQQDPSRAPLPTL